MPPGSRIQERGRLAPPFTNQLNLSISYKGNLRPLSALKPTETTCYSVMCWEVHLKTLLILKAQHRPLTTCTRTWLCQVSRRRRMTSLVKLKRKFMPTQSLNQTSLTTSTTLKVSLLMPSCHQGLVRISQLKWNCLSLTHLLQSHPSKCSHPVSTMKRSRWPSKFA